MKGDLNVDVEHYQSFTPLYISKILNAYKQYRGKIICDIRDRIEKLENVPKEPTLEERIELAKTSLQSMYNSRADKRFYDYGGVTYDFIKRNELLPLSKSLVEEAMKYGKKEQLKKSRNSAYKDALIGGHKNLNDAREKKEAMIRSYARTYVVQKWLNTFDDESFAKFLEKVDRNMI